MMLSKQVFLVISMILSVNHITCFYLSEIEHLRDHFIRNLVEENRELSLLPLTDDIEKEIDLKVNGFLNTIKNVSVKRKKRDTDDDLVFDETSDDIVILRGFESRGYVPINFPQDICMFSIKGKIFAVGLTFGQNITSTLIDDDTPDKRSMMIFIREDGKFRKINEYKSKYLTKIDCATSHDAGYIAVVNSFNKSEVDDDDHLLEISSFVMKISLEESGEPVLEYFQKFAVPDQNSVRLWSYGAKLYLIFTYNTGPSTPLSVCTLYNLDSTGFSPIDDLPCQNAHVVEFFTVNHQLMIFIGNYQDNKGRTNTFSYIMKYDLDKQRFVEHQKISTNAIAVCRYFYLDEDNQRQHFLFIGNSFEVNENGEVNYDVHSMIYKVANGYFIPLQTINTFEIQDMLPIIGDHHVFHFLIASEHQEVQIYSYNGWKFEESHIDFTGYAFGAGVVKLRAFDHIINGTTTIVVANQDSFDETWNVYTALYETANDPTKLQESISKWCIDAQERLYSFDVDDTNNVLNSVLSITDPESEAAKFMGKIFLRNSTVGMIKAKEVRGKTVFFSNETAERIQKLSDRLSKLSMGVKHVTSKIQFIKATQQRKKRQTTQMLVRKLIVNGPLNIEMINGRPISNLVYVDNRRNKNLKNIIANRIDVSKELFVNEGIGGIEFKEDNVLLNQPSQILRTFMIQNISVDNIANIEQVNEIPFDDFFKLLRRKLDIKIPNTISELTVDTMTIGRFLNNHNFTAIAINSLKTSGDQMVMGMMKIGELKTRRILFQKLKSEEKISGVPLELLVDINDTRSERSSINQNVRFTEDLNVNRLFVLQRINNINVRNGEFQVMRKRGPEMQIVTGEKFFDNINLKSPILLRGKIESQTLQRMNPISTINKDLVLEGDYTISGPVTIRNVLNVTEDIVTNDPNLTLRRLVESGFNLFTTEETKSKLIFNDVVKVKENLQAKSLNEKPVDSFVKMNVRELQVIQGKKTFKNGLMVHGGTIQADVVNGVDLHELNRTSIKRVSSSTQFIDGNVEMVSLETPSLTSPNLGLNGKDFNLVMNANKQQNIKEMNLNVLKVRNVNVENLYQREGGKVFGSDLEFLIDDAVLKGSSFETEVIAPKTFSTLYVEHLMFSETNEWKSIIKNYEQSMAEDVNVSGNLVFDKPLRIKNLLVTGTINNISVDDMANNWLRTDGDQDFTAPQTFRSMEILKDLKLTSNTLNHVDLQKLVSESIWTDEPFAVESLTIEGTAHVAGRLLTPTINGGTFGDNLILNNTANEQIIKTLVVDDTLITEYLGFNKVNGIDSNKTISAFTTNENPVNLQVRGKILFNYQPEILNFNDYNLQELHDNVWMADTDVVLIGEDIQFLGDVKSNGAIYANTLNNYNLDYYNENYFSLTKNQNIGTYLNVNGTAYFNKALSAQKIIVPGLIKSDVNDKGFSIDNFEKNVLRKDVEQTILGEWHVKTLLIEGNYNGRINGFNFKDDMLHLGNMETAQVTGHKVFKSLECHNVGTQYLNDIDIIDWYNNAVRLNTWINNNQHIDGHVVLNQAIFYNDVQVIGSVNGMKIAPNTILTKSGEGQVINGDLTIQTMTPEGFSTLFIDHLFIHDSINGKNITDIFENTLKSSDSRINSKHVIFEKPLIADDVETNEKLYGVQVSEFLRESNASHQLIKFQDNLRYLTKVGDNLRTCVDEVAIELNHFEYHQSIHGVNIQKTVPFSIDYDSTVEYVLAVHERNINASLDVVRFHRWCRENHSFMSDDSLIALSFNIKTHQLTKLDKIIFKSKDHLFVEIFDTQKKEFHQSLMLFDSKSLTFVTFLQTSSNFSSQFFTIDDGASSCYGLIYPSFENINIICEDKIPIVLKTVPIRMVSSQNGVIILLTDDHQLQVWYQHEIRQILKVMKPQSFTSIRFKGKLYLAVTSDKAEHSTHHGSIEIFESVKDVNFIQVQSFDLESPFSVHFSVIPSDDLLLYILTKNPGKSLSVFKYAGASYFDEIIESSTIVDNGSHLSTMIIDGKTEIIAVVSEDVYIIAAMLREY